MIGESCLQDFNCNKSLVANCVRKAVLVPRENSGKQVSSVMNNNRTVMNLWFLFIGVPLEFSQKLMSLLAPRSPKCLFNFDGLVKSPYAALRRILRHCGVQLSTPHSSEFARLAYGAFYKTVCFLTFYEYVNFISRHAKKQEQKLISRLSACASGSNRHSSFM